MTYDFVYVEGGTIVSSPAILANDPSTDGRFKLDAAAGVVVQDTMFTVKATYPVIDPNTGLNFQREMTFTAKSPCSAAIVSPSKLEDHTFFLSKKITHHTVAFDGFSH